MNFAQFLRGSSRLDPSGTVLLHGGRRVDYLALEMGAQRMATILARQHATGQGDRVAVLLPDTPEFAFAAFGILWAGAVVHALDAETDEGALAESLRAAGVKLLIGWHALAEAVEAVSSALGIDWLLIEPREFSRLLAATPPRNPLADVLGDAPAIASGAQTVTHAELAIRAKQAGYERGLRPGVVLDSHAPLSDLDTQIGTLHAAVAAGAAVSFATTPAFAVKEGTWLCCRSRT